MATAKGKDYTADSVKHLTSVEAVRSKASMYLGELGPAMVFSALRETGDNVVDEAIEGHCTAGNVYVDEDKSYWVWDNGRGMPVGPMKVTDSVSGRPYTVSSLYAITGLLHAGGKLSADDSAYEASRGCFHGDTPVRLLDGRVLTMKDIYEQWTSDRKPLPILSFNLKKQQLEPSVISYAQITMKTKKLVEVEYDNGVVSKVTPDHPFYVRRGGSIKKVQAQHLRSGDSLVSTYYTKDKDDVVAEVLATWNHTVRTVRPLNLRNAIPVYDITVDKNHTFFIGAQEDSDLKSGYVDSGVLVSNTHGIGIKATNFVSHYFEVWTFFKGQWYNIRYENGKVVQDVRKMSKAPEHPYKKGSLKSGTLIHFRPDPKIVQADSFPLSLFAEWAKIAAYFTPTLSITLADWKGRERTWHIPEGPRQYVVDKIAENKCSLIVEGQLPFVHQSALADVIVQWTDYDGCDMQAFTNGLNNPDKGVHFQSFFKALDTALKPYVSKKQKFSVLELREGVVGLVNAKLAAPKFSSQTKDKLVDERADEPLAKLIEAELTAFFKKNRKLADSICARADHLRTLRSQFTASKKVLQVLSKARTKGLPAKCQSSPNCKTEQRELYLVEGDSAGGSGKNARDPFYQEILPLKGKIMNAMKAKPEVLLTSEEVVNIFTMVGFDAKAEDPIARLRCGGGLFLLADPDPDGSHINCLLISALYKYMPSLFSMGLVYVVNAPEWFAVNKAGKLLHAPTKAQLQQVLKEAGTPNLDIRHVKGYGELDAKFLRMLAFDPATRLCTRVTTDNAKSVQRFVALMSDDVQARRDLLGV